MTKPKQKKRVKAWAVIDEEILKKEKLIFGKIFNPTIECFSEAIFSHDTFAEKYAERLRKGNFKILVVPCEITYEI